MYTIWNAYLNKETFNFNGSEWVIDGELGRMVYPGNWEKSIALTYYSHGWGYDHEEVA